MELKRYYNELTKEIVEYPEEAAALFDVLKPVPSERNKPVLDAENQLDIQIEKPNNVDEKVKASNKTGNADAK